MVLIKGKGNTLISIPDYKTIRTIGSRPEVFQLSSSYVQFSVYEANLKRMLVPYHQDSEYIEFSIWKWCISPVLCNKDGIHL